MEQIWTKYAILERTSPYISFFKTFTSNRPFICNHHQTIKQKYRTNILWTNKYVSFSRKMDKKIYKSLSLSQNPLKHFVIELVQGNS